MMTVPPEVAWLVPLALPFLMGLLVGAIVKRAVKLLTALAALAVLLIATGSLTLEGVRESAMQYLPRLTEAARDWINVVPYTSTAFLVGLALGLWKG
jgi:uncharacterized membrane protein (Fun14 family)